MMGQDGGSTAEPSQTKSGTLQEGKLWDGLGAGVVLMDGVPRIAPLVIAALAVLRLRAVLPHTLHHICTRSLVAPRNRAVINTKILSHRKEGKKWKS